MDGAPRLIVSALFLLMAVFTLGASLGWRWEARGERAKFEPVWIFVLMELTWLAGIVLLFLNAGGWLAAVTLTLWAVALFLRVRGRLSRRRQTA